MNKAEKNHVNHPRLVLSEAKTQKLKLNAPNIEAENADQREAHVAIVIHALHMRCGESEVT